jgi:hypothetical protein
MDTSIAIHVDALAIVALVMLALIAAIGIADTVMHGTNEGEE